MNQEEILEILTKTGCLSKMDTDTPAVDTSALLEDPIVTNRMAVELLQQLPRDTRLDAVLCAHNDADMLFAYSVATAAWARFVCAEVEGDKVSLLNGAMLKKGQKVLIVDDMIESEEALLALIKTVKDAGARVMGVASLVQKVSCDSLSVDMHCLMTL